MVFINGNILVLLYFYIDFLLCLICPSMGVLKLYCCPNFVTHFGHELAKKSSALGDDHHAVDLSFPRLCNPFWWQEIFLAHQYNGIVTLHLKKLTALLHTCFDSLVCSPSHPKH